MIHLLGAGSIGSLIAHTLRKKSYPVTILLRASRARLEKPDSYAITVASKFNGQEKVEVSQGYDIEPSDVDTTIGRDAIKLLIVCTKAFAVADAVRPLRTRFDSDTVLVVLHNGIGVHEDLCRPSDERDASTPSPPLIEGFLSHGVYAVDRNSVVHAGKGDFYLSSRSDTPRTRDSLQLLSELLVDLQASQITYQSFQVKQMEKLLINSVINPITAIQNHKNGKTSKYPHLVRAIIVESLSVLRIAHPGLSFVEANISQMVNLVIANTAENKSSMLQDLLAGRRTEIDYINGAICALASKHRLVAPINTALVKMVKQKSSSLDISRDWQNLLQSVEIQD